MLLRRARSRHIGSLRVRGNPPFLALMQKSVAEVRLPKPNNEVPVVVVVVLLPVMVWIDKKYIQSSACKCEPGTTSIQQFHTHPSQPHAMLYGIPAIFNLQ